MEFSERELDLLRSKKIVRNNLINYNYKLVEKLDFLSNENNMGFSETVYMVINNFDIGICANCIINKTQFISVKRGYKKYCSTKCSNSHIDTIENKKEVYLQRYGVTNPSLNIDVKKKISEKNKNQTIETKEKRKKTNLEKYGYEYNVVNPVNFEKRRESSLSQETIEKRKKTNLEKYGVDVPLKSNLVKSKFKKTNLEKWGSEHFRLSDKYKDLNNKRHINKLNSEHSDIIIESFNNKIYYAICKSCNTKFEISTNAYNIRKNRNLEICNLCNPVESNVSLLEKDLLDYIKSIYNGLIETSYRRLGFELDIFSPELNLGFEFNGIYWHSEFFKNKEYHYNKYCKCLENNINLIQIWEDDWIYKKDIIKSIISNKIGKSNKIWARKCELKEVTDSRLIKDFLNENHLQGWCVSSIKIGLFQNDELVSLMTFGQLRKNLGTKKVDHNYEMLRFCNKLNLTVIGGASKMLSFFRNNYNPITLISYSKNDYSTGNLYKKLGFNKSNDNISYYWVVDNIKKNRWNFRKDKLIKMGYDSNKTETKIMQELGYYRVYDSGNTKWIL